MGQHSCLHISKYIYGTEVKFGCVAVEADVLAFFVNDTAASEQIVIDKGFIELGAEVWPSLKVGIQN